VESNSVAADYEVSNLVIPLWSDRLFEILVQHRISIGGILVGSAQALVGGLDMIAPARKQSRSEDGCLLS